MNKEKFNPPKQLGPERIFIAAFIYLGIMSLFTIYFIAIKLPGLSLLSTLACVLLFCTGLVFTEVGYLYTPVSLFDGLLKNVVIIGGKMTYVFWPIVSVNKRQRVDGKIRSKSFVIYSFSRAGDEKQKGGAIMKITGTIGLQTVHPVKIILLSGREKSADIIALDILDSSARPYIRAETNDSLVFDLMPVFGKTSVNPHITNIQELMLKAIRETEGYSDNDLIIGKIGQRVDFIYVDDIEEPKELRELRQKIPAEMLERISKQINMKAAENQVNSFIKKMSVHNISATDSMNAVLAIREESTRTENVLTLSMDQQVARYLGEAAKVIAPHLAKMGPKNKSSSKKPGPAGTTPPIPPTIPPKE